MIKIHIGLKGSGKTKKLIEAVIMLSMLSTEMLCVLPTETV